MGSLQGEGGGVVGKESSPAQTPLPPTTTTWARYFSHKRDWEPGINRVSGTGGGKFASFSC